MAKIDNSAELLKAQAHIWTQTFNFKNSASLKCAVQLGIPDAIHKSAKPMTLSELAAALPINPSKAPYLHRLMRILVNAGFFLEEKPGQGKKEEETAYSLSSSGCLLLNDEPLNARELVLLVLDPVMVKPWNALNDWFRNDDATPFETANGKNIWDYNAEEPRFRKLFNEAMASDSELITKVLVSDCKFVFEGLKSVVDVGGGTGTVARAIAKTFLALKCSVLDLPHVVANLQGLHNLDFVAGDMFAEIPHANAILLKWILHDWNDEDCIKILKNCKKSIPEKQDGGKVIIIDMVREQKERLDDDSLETQISLDMEVLVIYGAKERTEKEWAALIWNAGFSDYKLFPILGARCLIEVYP